MTGPKLPSRSPGLDQAPKRGPYQRRSMAIGIGLSAVLHVIVILLYSLRVNEWGPPKSSFNVESVARPFFGMRVVRVVEVPPPESQVRTPVEEQEPKVEPEVEVQGPDPAEGPGDEGLEGETTIGVRAAEVLKVRVSDTRLWRAALPEDFQPSEANRLQLELSGGWVAYFDSVAAALAAEAALTDWTRTDGKGNRWGFSPEKVHLGSLTLPFPMNFGGNSWQRERAARRASDDADILNGVKAQAIRAGWAERAKRMRARNNRNRRESAQRPDN